MTQLCILQSKTKHAPFEVVFNAVQSMQRPDVSYGVTALIGGALGRVSWAWNTVVVGESSVRLQRMAAMGREDEEEHVTNTKRYSIQSRHLTILMTEQTHIYNIQYNNIICVYTYNI